jgi:flavin reductase (DIM6/NTAB) family NADH-FMN oxidoreductase RutF
MPQTFSFEDIMAMDQRYRGLFVNSLSGYKSANLIGTADSQGNTNLSIVSSVVHIGANPPFIAFIQRPVSVERHTYDNIMETGVYTINAVSEAIVPAAHQTSARYEKEQSEFDFCGLTAEYMNDFPAPFVKESPLKIGVSFVQEMDIELNGTKLIIGKIAYVSIANSEVLATDGAIDITQLKIAAVSSLDGYTVPLATERYAYAKPDCAPTKLKL